MRLLFGLIFSLLFASCSSTKVLVKNCDEISDDVYECELIKEL